MRKYEVISVRFVLLLWARHKALFMLAVEVAVAANVGEVTVITLVAAVALSTFTSTECKAVAGMPSYNVKYSNNCNQ